MTTSVKTSRARLPGFWGMTSDGPPPSPAPPLAARIRARNPRISRGFSRLPVPEGEPLSATTGEHDTAVLWYQDTPARKHGDSMRFSYCDLAMLRHDGIPVP